MSSAGVQLQVSERVAMITIDRPGTRNAVDRAVMAELGHLLDQVDAGIIADEIGVVGVRGGGDRVFISGGDLKELAQIRTEPEASAMSSTMRTCLDRLASLAVPTVALMNGHAHGGGAEVAVACDMRLAADDINIAFNQVALAIMPAWGGVERLTSLVGRGRALQLLLTGRVLPVAQASAIGLVEQVVPRAEFEAEGQALLNALAAVPSVPSRAMKALVASVVPATAPESAPLAVAEFARSWVAEQHWAAADAAARQRSASKAVRVGT